MANTRRIRKHPRVHTSPVHESNIVDAVMVRDAAYFEQHPGAQAYTRLAVAGEFWPNDPPTGTRVVVRRIEPGIRTRMFADYVVFDVDTPKERAA
jgi:hypothetical protein